MSIHTNDSTCPSCEEKLTTAHPYLKSWFHDHVKGLYNNAHICWAFRDQASQDQAVKEGKSKLKWPHSPHNHMESGKPCSLALDLFQIVDGVAKFSYPFYAALNKHNESLKIPIRWGATFKKLVDSDHFEVMLESLPAIGQLTSGQKNL